MALEVALINLLDSKGQTLKPSPRSDLDAEKISKQIPIANDQTLKQTPASNAAQQTSKQTPITQLPNYPVAKADGDILELVQSKWPDIITEVKPHNHSLSGFLMGMKPKEASNVSLTLSTKYSFHRDRLSDIKNKKIIEDAVEKVCGHKLSLNCVLEK
jgi:hypothetical protein